MLTVAKNLGLSSILWTRHAKLDDARTAAIKFNDVRLTVVGCDGLYWVVSAPDAAKLRKAGYETI
jgi:hypothetical protein